MMVFAIHGHKSAMGAHVSLHPEPLIHLPPHPIPLSCPRAPTLNPQLHAWNLHWSSICNVLCYFCLPSTWIMDRGNLGFNIDQDIHIARSLFKLLPKTI